MSEQIKASVIAHSKNAYTGKEIITFELEFPRIILSEWNTHGAISKNASSSRAIPVKTMLEQVRNNPAYPVRFGKANTGMQDAGEHAGAIDLANASSPAAAWEEAAECAAYYSEKFHQAGYAKQICNRLIEPFQMMKVVATATDWENFFYLRDHPAADPTIEALAKAMRKGKDESSAVILFENEWHLPYYAEGFWKPEHKDTEGWYDKQGTGLEDAIQISLSCCSQVSYRRLDDSLEKAKSVVSRLNLSGDNDEPAHASPAQHQGSPVKYIVSEVHGGKMSFHTEYWQDGVTHVDRDGTLCSNNFKEWIQYRALIPNNVKKG